MKKQCQYCGNTNLDVSRFCGNCGKDMDSKKISFHKSIVLLMKRKQFLPFKNNKMNRKDVKILLLTVGMLTAGSILFMYLYYNAQLGPTPQDIVKGNPAIESQVVTIASHFVCICGKCSRISVESCRCSLAAREREFIRQKIKKGDKDEAIIAAVDAVFGGKK